MNVFNRKHGNLLEIKNLSLANDRAIGSQKKQKSLQERMEIMVEKFHL
jgi:hypothetical protein